MLFGRRLRPRVIRPTRLPELLLPVLAVADECAIDRPQNEDRHQAGSHNDGCRPAEHMQHVLESVFSSGGPQQPGGDDEERRDKKPAIGEHAAPTEQFRAVRGGPAYGGRSCFPAAKNHDQQHYVHGQRNQLGQRVMGISRRACFQGNVGNGGAKHGDNDNPSQPPIEENRHAVADVHQAQPLPKRRSHELDHAQHKARGCVSADGQQSRTVKRRGASASRVQEHNRHHEKDHQRNEPQDPVGERVRQAAQQAPMPVGGACLGDGFSAMASFRRCGMSGFRFFLVDGRLPRRGALFDQLARPSQRSTQQPFGKQRARERDDDLPQRIQHNRAAFRHAQVIPPPFTHCFYLQKHASGQAQLIAYRIQPLPDQVEYLRNQTILGQFNWQCLLFGGRYSRRRWSGFSLGANRRASRSLRDRGERFFELNPLLFVLENRQRAFCLCRRDRRCGGGCGGGGLSGGALTDPGAKDIRRYADCKRQNQ